MLALTVPSPTIDCNQPLQEYALWRNLPGRLW